MNKEKWIYYLIRTATYPFSYLPYSWLRAIGKGLGTLGFYAMRDYRKRALSNLALATDLALTPKQLVRYAKQSFQNLAINCLEYPKFAVEKNLSRVIQCENPAIADALYQKGQGIIFFCGHQSNWEALFLDGTSRMKGIAIGKPIKNKLLYHWILSIREKNGGKIVAPRNAVREGFRALRQGVFMGIVGDQGMPGSGYSFPFLGRRAWTSPAPALLAYKTNSPIILASTRRVPGGYRIRYSDPIWPDLTQPAETDVIRMMDQTLTLLQESIKYSPGEWLWQHNRWKQQTMHNLYRRFRQDCICVILPENLEPLLPHLPTLKEIYAPAFLSLIVPASHQNTPLPSADETIYYTHLEQTLLSDFRFKLVFNFTDYQPIHAHYEKLSALHVLDVASLKQIASEHLLPHHNLSDILLRALCRPGSLWENAKR
jgi:KDO2-lipid IV(A) lauroyltransferase